MTQSSIAWNSKTEKEVLQHERRRARKKLVREEMDLRACAKSFARAQQAVDDIDTALRQLDRREGNNSPSYI